MENKNSYQADIFTNRLKKKYKELRKWARKNRITCYRLYDKDIPEIPVSLDIYEFLTEEVTNPLECAKFLSTQNEKISKNDLSIEKEISSRTYGVLYLYERPYEKEQKDEEEWLNLMAISASYVLNIPVNHIVKKTRKMQKGLNQYEKSENPSTIKGIVQEQGQLFKVDLSTYLDTGLFLDHRPLRLKIREIAKNKSVLNLFCYTASFSVYAASGNAKKVQSVDLSNTYLNWANENMHLNDFFDKNKYIFTKADAIEWLENANSQEEKYDIIILDPPTFSNSKSAKNILDINKDWQKLVENAINLLNANGILYFSTNSSRLTFNKDLLQKNVDCIDITQNTIPKDFESTRCHRCWKITKKQ